MPGASAVPVLAPLSLAVLALGAALSIVGLVLRYVFGALTVAIAALLAWLTAQVAFAPPASAVAAIVTEATGITGEAAVAALVAEHRRHRLALRDARGVARAARRRRLHPRHRAPLAGERATLSNGCRAAPPRRRPPRHPARTMPSTRGMTSHVARIRQPDR